MIGSNQIHTRSRAALLFLNKWPEHTVADALEKAGVEVERYGGLLSLVAALQAPTVHIAIVEDHGIHLPSCMAALRFRGAATVPIVAVGKGSLEEVERALRHGACDYGALGEAMELLVSRVRARMAVYRDKEHRTSLRLGDCELDGSVRCLHHPGGELRLTWREFALAWVLFDNAGRVVNLQSLSQQVWGRDASVAKRTIEQHVCRLRRKLLQACAESREVLELHAIPNIGYRLVVQARVRASSAGRDASAVGLTFCDSSASVI